MYDYELESLVLDGEEWEPILRALESYELMIESVRAAHVRDQAAQFDAECAKSRLERAIRRARFENGLGPDFTLNLDRMEFERDPEKNDEKCSGDEDCCCGDACDPVLVEADAVLTDVGEPVADYVPGEE